MGLLNAFSRSPQFQQQLGALTQMQGPGMQPIQRQPMANMPPIMNPGGGIGGGAMTPDMVRMNPPGAAMGMGDMLGMGQLGGSDMLRYAQLPNIMQMPKF